MGFAATCCYFSELQVLGFWLLWCVVKPMRQGSLER